MSTALATSGTAGRVAVYSGTFDPITLGHEDVAKRGGGVARQARLKLEAETGKKLVSPQNAKELRQISQDKSKK